MKNIRNLHLCEAARRVAARSGQHQSDIRHLAETAIKQPAPGYYVGMDHAMRMLAMHRRGKWPHAIGPLKRRMWEEIFMRVDRIMQRHTGLTPGQAMQRVLCNGEASSFFIEPITALRILRKHRKEIINI